MVIKFKKNIYTIFFIIKNYKINLYEQIYLSEFNIRNFNKFNLTFFLFIILYIKFLI